MLVSLHSSLDTGAAANILPVAEINDMDTFNVSVPCILANLDFSSGDVRNQCLSYLEAFPGTEEKAKNRRGQRALTPLSADSMKTTLQNLSERVMNAEITKPENLKCAVLPSIFVVEKKLQTSSFELGYLPTIRTCISGKKNIIFTDVLSIYSFFDGQGKKYDSKQIVNFLKEAKQADIEKYVGKGFQLFYHCQEVGQSIYCPPGFLFWEVIADSSDFAGCKAVCFFGPPSDSDGLDSEARMSAVCKCLMAHGTSNTLCVAARDVLATASS